MVVHEVSVRYNVAARSQHCTAKEERGRLVLVLHKCIDRPKQLFVGGEML